MPAGDIETTLRRALLPFSRHQADGMRPVTQRDRDHFRRSGHFKIERDSEFFHQAIDIRVGDMPTVLAQMRGDTIGAGRRGKQRRAHRVGVYPSARISYRRDMIDIHAEPQTRGARTRSCRLIVSHGSILAYARRFRCSVVKSGAKTM